MHDPADLDRALSRWRDLLDPANVIVERDGVAPYEATTFATAHDVPAVVRPGSTEQVQAVVRVASECRVPLYPISRGRNWGYGGRVPARAGCVVVDLGRMNRIVDFDPKLAYVTVEPGVTQAQLYDFLARENAPLWMDATTSATDASIVGNALDRGHGLTPYADHARYICGLEVVLASGERVATGYARFAGSKLAALDAFGFGPALDGLFVQSSFGIVTKLTVWLYPIPERVEALFFGIDDDALMSATVDRLLPAKLHGMLPVGPRLGNEYRTLQTQMRYPWHVTGGKTPLTPVIAADLCNQRGLSKWSGFVAFYGAEPQVRAQRQLVEGWLRELGVRGERSEVWPDGASGGGESGARHTFGRLLRGEPFGAAVKRTYWRKPEATPVGPEPERDRCGIIWCTPLLPFRGEDARRVSDVAREIILRHGFEPDVSFLALRERVLHSHILDRLRPRRPRHGRAGDRLSRRAAAGSRRGGLSAAPSRHPFDGGTHRRRSVIRTARSPAEAGTRPARDHRAGPLRCVHRPTVSRTIVRLSLKYGLP